jgi:3-hydroxyacyl-[acyl-carrier-protein] dehydratase
MVLKDNFFRVKSFCQTETGFDYTIELNSEHFIYQAHFPENPVTPGVCIIQIIKEILTEILQCNLFLKKINNVKFLNVINPLENKEVTFSISISSEEENTHKIGAVVFNGDNRFAKLSMLFTNQ